MKQNRYEDLGFVGTTPLLVGLPDSGGCVDWWRAIVPLYDLARNTPNLEIDAFEFGQGTVCSWLRAHRSFALMMPGPHRAEHHGLLSLCKMIGRKVWIDMDDDYWNIPESSYAFSYFNGRAKELLQTAAEGAAVLSVSTPEMANVVRRFNKTSPVHVVPNAIPDEYVWPTSARQKLVIYRGSYKTHAGDLFSVADDLRAVVRENPNWTFRFYGGHPVFISEPNVQFVDSTTIPTFHAMIYESGASILINPLEFSPFNECKSNIAWIEGSLAGAAVLAPDLPSYREPGATLYKPGRFGARLREMIAMNDLERGQLVQRAQRAIDGKYRLSIVNRMRSKIIKDLAT